MKATQIKKDIYWVGTIDWRLREFHGYRTPEGSSYNAYIIKDKQTVLIDTAKSYLTDELIERIKDVVNPQDIDLVVVNHVEMDHSGALPRIMELCPKAKIVTNPAAQKNIALHYHKDYEYITVKTGDSINIGSRTLSFIQTPMVHWPDNMFTYCPEEKILFSNDAFGQHIASSERFDDQLPLEFILSEARKYYANIVLPYSGQVLGVLEAAKGLDIQTICPSHGIIWRENIPAIVAKYQKWAANQWDKKAVIVYDSMWHSTEKIAHAVRDAFEAKEYDYVLFDLKDTHISDIMPQVMEAEYICVGSPTLNKNIMPTVASFLTYLQGLSPKNRKAILFGSYGWAPLNMKFMERFASESNLDVKYKANINFVPTQEDLSKIQKDIEDIL